MAKNLIPTVCELLDVEVGETFKIRDRKGKGNGKYCIDENGALLYLSAKKPIPHLMGIKALLNGKLEIIKLPWKPKDGEAFYTVALSCDDNKLYIDKRYWSDKYIDHLGLFKAGWVYRTKEEAEAALPKVAEELGVEYEI